ncbi:MAG: hypothetical protein DRP83_00635 [Planctomycetota bacterium]|nr:MAG: hypothetical protein DRP83_00635 [Planctomycetota bacterium]
MADNQIFFRADDKDTAYWAHKKRGDPLWAIVDKRSKKPKPLMFVVCPDMERVFFQMDRGGMRKRMWVAKLVAKERPF